MTTNVIPMRRELPRNQAHTHFDRAALIKGTEYEWDPDVTGDSLTTLCGREATAILDKDMAYPECADCIAEWASLGWSFPLPDVVCTD